MRAPAERLSQTEQPPAMRESEGTSMPSEMQQLQNRFTSLLNNLKRNSKIVELMKSPLGQYLDSHPFLALVLLVFIVMATLPTALFLSFAVISFVVTSVGFILLEGCLLFIGVLVLLCVLCSLSIIAFSVTAILSAFYVLTSNVVNQYQIQRIYFLSLFIIPFQFIVTAAQFASSRRNEARHLWEITYF